MWYSSFVFFVMFILTLPLVYKRVFPVGGYTVLGAGIGLILSAFSYSPVALLAMAVLGLLIDLLYARCIHNAVAWNIKFCIFAAATPILLAALPALMSRS